MTDPRTLHNIAALPDLLRLLESHLDLHGRIVPLAQWESIGGEESRAHLVPEPDCRGACQRCADFGMQRCTLREEAWAVEWMRLRKRYPQLVHLEVACADLMVIHPQWASALYWTFVQPWDAWNPAKRKDWTKAGIEWLADEFAGWLPVYEPERMPIRSEGPKDQEIIRLRIEGLSYHAIAKQLRCSKTTVRAVLSGKDVREGRIMKSEVVR